MSAAGPVVATALGTVLFLILVGAAWVSRSEGEGRAALLLGLVAFPVSAPFFLPLLMPETARGPVAVVLLVLAALLAVALLLPLRGGKFPALGTPVPGLDERDIMFSRDRLVPGTERFAAYYRAHPEYREADDAFRRESGFLSPKASLYHPEGFAATAAAFWTIERLRPFVEGEKRAVGVEPVGSSSVRPVSGATGEEEAREPGQPPVLEGQGPSTSAMTRFLKGWALKMGAHSVGVTEVRDYHLYTFVGRGEEYGKKVDLDHPYAVAFTVEMDHEMVGQAPKSATSLESSYQYLRGGAMAAQMADLIRRLGYRARAHIDGRYRVICPLVARDAGLGELGRMGLLMTPRLGPRVRIAVVTTDLPLEVDGPSPDPTVIDFCLRCRKCANCCPSDSISFGPPEKDENGVLRWKIDSEACFTMWHRMGTDCARCMAVCPYSHEDNVMHAFVRWGIGNNVFFRRGALWLDDFVYGRNPPPKEDLEWMKTLG